MQNNIFKIYNKNKNIYLTCSKICGLNNHGLKRVYLNMGWSLNNKQPSLKNEQLLIVAKILDYYSSIFKNKIFNNVESKKRLKNYVGMRHILKLPVKGQRTHTNSHTPRRNIKTEV
jgi:small subunit ribosomal protein S13